MASSSSSTPPSYLDPSPSPSPSPSPPGNMLALAALLLMLLLILLFLFFLLYFACSRPRWPWRSRTSPPRHQGPDKVDDLEAPLFSEDLDQSHVQNNTLSRKFISEESSFHLNRNTSSATRPGLAGKQKVTSTDLHVNLGDNITLDVDLDESEHLLVGQTLKRSPFADQSFKSLKLARSEDAHFGRIIADDGEISKLSAAKDTVHQHCCLNIEVVSGPSRGLLCSRDPKDISMLQVTIGRVPPSDLLLKDSEVSGKHAVINWNKKRSTWELKDLGSLNGTFLNSKAIHQSDSSYRQCSEPVDLHDGDTITLGTSSKLLVSVVSSYEHPIPFKIGKASDPMAMRRGGKKLPMEDMYCCQWPLPGVEQFGLFGIFDGHGGVEAARTASKMLPSVIANMLSNHETKESVISLCDASKVLKDAFSQTEAAMDHQYEGCTATVLLVWADHRNEFFAQCANVGDSACVINLNGTIVSMTQDHRVVSSLEQTRMREMGKPLKDGETRLCGLNLARMLGDKFLKEQEPRFISEPYTSQVVHIKRTGMEFALLASDGLWDVMSTKKAAHLIAQMKERSADQDQSADMIANSVINEARTLRTKDNTQLKAWDPWYGFYRTPKLVWMPSSDTVILNGKTALVERAQDLLEPNQNV